jgi:ornithine carbamoyltransferase
MIPCQKFKLREGVIFQDLGKEALLLDTKTEEVFSFDPVARDIWLALQGSQNMEEALAELLSHYDVNAETLRGDIVVFLEDIRRANLLAS